MEMDATARSDFSRELEDFFSEASMEREADVVSIVLVTAPNNADSAQIAAFPGAAIAGFAPVVVEWFLALVRGFAKQLKETSLEEGSKSVVTSVLDWIEKRIGKSKKSIAEADVSDRVKTLAEIVKTLEDAGWPKDAVEAAADDLWRRGKRAAEALAKAPAAPAKPAGAA